MDKVRTIRKSDNLEKIKAIHTRQEKHRRYLPKGTPVQLAIYDDLQNEIKHTTEGRNHSMYNSNSPGHHNPQNSWSLRSASSVPSAPSMTTILFVGPPGTGKTQLCYTAAERMGKKAVVIPMANSSCIMDKIKEAITNDPSRVIILDELEKADRKTQEELVAIFDGRALHQEEQGNFSNKPPYLEAQPLPVHLVFLGTSTAAGVALRNQPTLHGQALRKAVMNDGILEPLVEFFQEVVPVRHPTRSQFRSALRRAATEELQREGQKRNINFILADEELFLDRATELYHPGSDYRQVNHIVVRVVREGLREILYHRPYPEHRMSSEYSSGEPVLVCWSREELDLLRQTRGLAKLGQLLHCKFRRRSTMPPLDSYRQDQLLRYSFDGGAA
jgi:DNA polymerase III delta prime subunit